MKLPSASQFQRASECPGSVHLPQVKGDSDDAREGRAKHRYVEVYLATRGDAEAAAKAVAGEFGPALGGGERFVDCSYLDGLLQTPGLELFPEHQQEIHGIRCRSDLVTSGSKLMVVDWKFGRGYVPPVRYNWQLRIGALALRRKAPSPGPVTGVLVKFDEDGSAWRDEHEFQEADWDPLEEELKAAIASIEEGAGVYKTGDHCKYCPGFTACPAQTSLVRQLAQPELVEQQIYALTDEDIGKAFMHFSHFKHGVMRRMEAFFRAVATERPIPLGNGRFYGKVETTRDVVDGKVAFEVLRDTHGQKVAEAACAFEASKASIKRALKEIAPQGALAEMERNALAAIKGRGGIEPKKTERIEEYEER